MMGLTTDSTSAKRRRLSLRRPALWNDGIERFVDATYLALDIRLVGGRCHDSIESLQFLLCRRQLLAQGWHRLDQIPPAARWIAFRKRVVGQEGRGPPVAQATSGFPQTAVVATGRVQLRAMTCATSVDDTTRATGFWTPPAPQRTPFERQAAYRLDPYSQRLALGRGLIKAQP